MSLRRSALTRLALATAVGALVTAAVATPATADDDWNDGGDPGTSTWDEGGQGGGDGGGGGGWNTGGNSNGNGNTNGTGSGNSNSNSNNWQNQNGGQGGGDGGDGGGWNQGGGDGGGGGQWNQGGGQGGDGQWNQGGHNDTQRLFRGRVTANTLLLRSKPTRASEVIRSVHRGEIVSIFCKTPGQNVDGNPLWYLLTDGTWAWGSARYIENIGEAPRWC
ncbi:SH3 domain-containing protein [Streptomyces sp. NPDC005811]|uniref:SH3 domain-containing protein n=1 Tax=Streptomyces sp. NPDC005811 TaxID=3154565 RepID=UPI0033E8D940